MEVVIMSEIKPGAVDSVIEGYTGALLWTETCRGTAEHEHPTRDPQDCDVSLSEIFSDGDVAPEAMAEIRAFVADFVTAQAADLAAWVEAQAAVPWVPEEDFGHNLLLSRNGHGAGFWDRGMGELGDRLHAAAKIYGEMSAYAGDDGLVHVA